MRTIFTKPRKYTVKVIGPIKSGMEFILDDEIRGVEASYPGKTITIDLTECPFMNSAALGVLLSAHQRLDKIGKRVRLFRPQREIVKLLELTRLQTIFMVVDRDEEEE